MEVKMAPFELLYISLKTVFMFPCLIDFTVWIFRTFIIQSIHNICFYVEEGEI